MTRFKLALALESLNLAFRPALDAAARMLLDGVQFDPVGPLAPAELGTTARRELKTLFRGHRLDVVALHCPLRRGLDSPEALDTRLDHLRKVAELARDLGCPRLVLPLPPLPRDDEPVRHQAMQQSLTELARIGDTLGVAMSLKVGADPAPATETYLAAFDSGSLRATLDPATLAARNQSTLDAVAVYAGRIDFVHAREARRGVSGDATEVPLGEGDGDWNLLVATLDAAGYRGYFTVTPQSGEGRPQLARQAVEFLRRFIPPPRG